MLYESSFIKEDDLLCHHGVKGQRWGIRRTPAQLGHFKLNKPKTKKQKSSLMEKIKKIKMPEKTKTIGTKNAKQKSPDDTKKTIEQAVPKKIPKKMSEMTNDELREKIERMKLEKEYLSQTTGKQKKGKEIISKILEDSTKNIGTQLVTYAMGTIINKSVKSNIVNPKKGQKDK